VPRGVHDTDLMVCRRCKGSAAECYGASAAARIKVLTIDA